ncbi:hypothetical protein [uncultured Alistipes sp.]|uniref:hypothetical protein n=1 Tax=uncultured Alistipes sp. TaxID=538949 RepID=UPI00261ACEFC|nr:hypothetical protein [uncultured Alistipes sp.]
MQPLWEIRDSRSWVLKEIEKVLKNLLEVRKKFLPLQPLCLREYLRRAKIKVLKVSEKNLEKDLVVQKIRLTFAPLSR